ncbi:MAG TPA: class I adenylate-forming enzyme family protein [Mycobacteriales bacterium]|nr:class I adenylate-forming enzyme family protein [Mycobacteriales bacterium]
MTISPAQTLNGWLSAVVAAQGSRPALHGDGTETSYAELWSRAGGMARQLLADDAIPAGSRIAVVGTNEPAYIEVFLGILRAGHVVVPLNPMLDVASLLAQIDLVEASLVVLGNVSTDIAEGLAASRRTVPLRTLRETSSPVAGLDGMPRVRPDSAAAIIPTSGSTGAPRGVLHTQATLLHCALQLSAVLPIRPDDRSVGFLPFFASIPEQILPILCNGGSVDVVPFDIERVADACRRSTCFDAIPTIMARLLDEAPLDSLANLRWVSFASEPMPPATLRRWQTALPGVEAHQFYGMTELVPATTASHRMLLEDPLTVGVAFPTSVVSQDAESGQLLVRSPAQMRGYYNNRAASSAAVTADGAIKTGDLGTIDERGWVYLTGRLKDLIITGGLNVAPAEIEAAACHHPYVGAAAVVGIPDPRWGETPVVIGVARDGSSLTAEVLLSYCRQELKGFKRPSAAAVVDSLPSTGIGKIAKNLLRDQIVRGEIALVRAE